MFIAPTDNLTRSWLLTTSDPYNEGMKSIDVVPGQRIRITMEGVVEIRDGEPMLRLTDGSLWHVLPLAATIEVVDPT